MSCPFMDPSMLSRIAPEKREELKEMYHKMQKEQQEHIIIDVKEENIQQNISADQMMMGMTGGQNQNQQCPFLNKEDENQKAGSGEQDSLFDMQEQLQNDPQAFMERMAELSNKGGSCPFMASKYFDPFNQKMDYGWNCHYKSKWDFLLNNKGRLSTRRFLKERKLLQRLPYPLKHSLFHPDDIKKLRDKPFSGLYFHFDKEKETANKNFKEEDYFEALEYYEQILSIFKWLEFSDKERQKDFLKQLKLEPLTDKDVELCEKDLEDDECEIEMRQNFVVQLLLNIGYCYMKLFFFDEALKCFNYVIELCPIASDAYLRRSQIRMYNKDSNTKDFKMAVDDVNKALERRPKDKFFNQHKNELMQVIQGYINQKSVFIKELVDKAIHQLQLKEKFQKQKEAQLEESKQDQYQINYSPHQTEQDQEIEYPEECEVLDIMKDKYYSAIQFFHETEDKNQMKVGIKEYQRFSYFYEKMSKNLNFDPEEIEEDVYNRLPDELKSHLNNQNIINEINKIRIKRAKKILEDEDVHILNFQLFQYAIKIQQKEKREKEKKEEEEKKKSEPQGKTSSKGSMSKLVIINIIFFLFVAGGIFFTRSFFMSPYSLLGDQDK